MSEKDIEQQQFYLEKAFCLFEVEGNGGAWYIPLADYAEIYEERLPNASSGLQELTMEVIPEEVGEYFCDLVIVDDEVRRINFTFVIFNN